MDIFIQIIGAIISSLLVAGVFIGTIISGHVKNIRSEDAAKDAYNPRRLRRV